MITIQKIDIADCDRSTDDQGYTSPGSQYVVCNDNDISRDYAYCDTEEEAEAEKAELELLEGIEIDTEKAIIWGTNGGVGYYINDNGGLELSDIIEGGLSEDEETAAQKELEIDTAV